MPPTTIRSPPAASDYMSLADYQSQTPESFTDGKPILHLHIPGAKASIPRSQCGSLAAFPAEAGGAERSGEDEKEEIADEPMAEEKLDIFVTSETFIVFNQRTESGVSIPYPAISIHALKNLSDLHAVWMQLDFADASSADDEFHTVELTLFPPDLPEGPTAAQLFEAISACSDLHPDPDNEEDEGEGDRIIFDGGDETEAVEGFTGVLRGAADGGLPPPLPGSGGWITADNMHEYFDEEGNWIGGGEDEPLELGEGAGRTRDRDELERDSINGHGEGEDTENKRPRVE